MVDYPMNILSVILIISIPCYITFLCFSFAFWGRSVKEMWIRIALFAVVQSLYLNFFLFVLPIPYYFLNSIASFFILFYLFFFRLSRVTKLKISTFAFATAVIVDGICGSVISLFLTREELLHNPQWQAAAYWPILTVFNVLTYLMARKQYKPGKKIFEYISKQRKKNIPYLLVFLFIQFLILFFLIAFHWEPSSLAQGWSIQVALYLSTALSLIIIFAALRVISQTKDNAVRMTQEVYIDDLNRMFTIIRGQRHDFLNHVQVIQSFVKLGKNADLERYIREMVGEITEINDIIQIGHPALAALIQAKLLMSVERKIRFEYYFSGLGDLSLGMKSIDVVKIAGNLIDNAFDEVSDLPVESRWVEIKSWTADGNLYLTVRNLGKLITDEEQGLLFLPGYSTKNKENHYGLGLSIVKERVEHYKGNIDVESTPSHGTIFKVKIPLTTKFGYS